MKKARFYKIPSASTPGKEYTVVCDINGIWHCQCFPYLRSKYCKHIAQAQDIEKAKLPLDKDH